MTQQRLAKPFYPVRWQGRIMTVDKAVREVSVSHATREGVSILASQMVSVGAQVNIEFYAKYRGALARFRAKTTVAYSRLLSGGDGVVLELRFTYLSKEEMHTYNNVLQLLANNAAEDV